MKKFLSVFSNGPTTTSNSNDTDAASSSKTSVKVAKGKEHSKTKSASPVLPEALKVVSDDQNNKNLETNEQNNQVDETSPPTVAVADASEASKETSKFEHSLPSEKAITDKTDEDEPPPLIDAASCKTVDDAVEEAVEGSVEGSVEDSVEEMKSCPVTTTDESVTSQSAKHKQKLECNAADPSSSQVHMKELAEYDLHERLANRLSALFETNKLTIKDLDERAIDALKEYGSIDAVIAILDEFEAASLEHVTNKSAFLCGLMKTHRQKEKHGKENASGKNSSASNTATQSTNGPANNPGPDEAKLKAILERTGYTLDVTSGQRKYGGPPAGYDEGSMPPGPGCEIFVGKIPKEVFEDDLIPVFEEIGKIWDLRLMIDPVSGFNRGFAFITYCDKDDASAAQIKFDGHEIKKGKHLKVNVSVPNLRLFVGNIPKSRSREEILAEFAKVTVGLVEVIVYSSPDDRKKNRGFCFLEYDSHKSASLAKRKLGTGRQKFWGCDILVDWADPQEEPDQETMSKVKVLYVRNLVSSITEENLRETFGQHGNVERVKKIKDYAFIHFEDRDQAVTAMKMLRDHEMQGVKISVSLAKPPSDRRRKEEILRNRERRVTQMMQERASLGLTTNPVAVAAAAAMASGIQGVHPALFNPAAALAAVAGHHHLHHHNQPNSGAVNQQPHLLPHGLSANNPAQVTPTSLIHGHHHGNSLTTNAGTSSSSSGGGRSSKGNNRVNNSNPIYPTIPATNQLPTHASYGRQVPSYQTAAASGWYPQDWSSYPIYPQNWVFDPRSGQSLPTPLPAGPSSQYPRMNINAAASMFSAIAAASHQRNNNRSLWTPNGNASGHPVMNGPQHLENNKTSNKNWNHRRNSNSGTRSDSNKGGADTAGR